MIDLNDLANPHLRGIAVYEPGKPIEDVAREHGLDPDSIIKLASNENPLGPSPKAIEAMRRAVEKAQLYPDGNCYHLRHALARHLGVDFHEIIIGNGSNEIIEFLGHAFLGPDDEVITARHAFAIYPIMTMLLGAKTIEVPDPGFVHDLPAMARAVTPKTKLFFIANPNNPTGTAVTEQTLFDVVASLPPRVIVVIDEAYYEFMPEPPRTLELVRRHPNVILMRTFSKIQGLAGLRIGYGIAQESLISILHKTRQPFNVNSIAQAGALAALADENHQRKTREVTWEGLQFLAEEFKKMGLEFVPSQANFIMVKVGEDGAGYRVFRELMKRGIIIRDPVALEKAGQCRTLIFDKTGTLTYGKPELVEQVVAAGLDRREVLASAASLERYSKHPLAEPILRAAEADSVVMYEASEISERPGTGLCGTSLKYGMVVTLGMLPTTILTLFGCARMASMAALY